MSIFLILYPNLHLQLSSASMWGPLPCFLRLAVPCLQAALFPLRLAVSPAYALPLIPVLWPSKALVCLILTLTQALHNALFLPHPPARGSTFSLVRNPYVK